VDYVSRDTEKEKAFLILKVYKVCLNSKFPPTLHSTLEIQKATLFSEKCVRLYLLGYLSVSVFTTQNFRIKEKNENLF
jgi:hypothetical protein